jgi:hypothetical protein
MLAQNPPAELPMSLTDVIVNGISTASTQHSDLVSVIQRNNGHVQSLLIAMRAVANSLFGARPR